MLTATRSPEVEPAHEGRSPRGWYWTMLAGGAMGIASASWQTIERIDWAAGQKAAGVCEISSKLSCSTVFEHWQSSALGIPNSVIALPVFAFIAAVALAGVMGADLPRRYLQVVLGMTVFMAGFITWYMWQTAFPIGVLCLFCAACMLAVVVAGIGITRVTAMASPGGALARMAERDLDVLAWCTLAVAVALMLTLGVAF